MADRHRNPGAFPPVGQKVLVDDDGSHEVGGLHVVGEDHRLHRTEPVEKTRERMRLVDELERFSRLSEPEQRAYEALGRVRERQASRRLPHGPAIVRRTPAARPAARRPRTSAKRFTSRAGPDDGSDEPAPGDAGPTTDHHESLRDSPAHSVALAWMAAGAAPLDAEEGKR